jgi:hypothetical protein
MDSPSSSGTKEIPEKDGKYYGGLSVLNLIMIARHNVFLLFLGSLLSLMMMGCPSKHVGPHLMKF